MNQIIINKNNLLAYKSNCIAILVPELITDDQIKIINSFTNNTKIFTWNKILYNSYCTYEINSIFIFLCTSDDEDNFEVYDYRNEKLIKNKKLIFS